MTRYAQLLSAYKNQVTENKKFVNENMEIAELLVTELTTFLGLCKDQSDRTAPELQFLKLDAEHGLTVVPDLRSAVLNAPEGRFYFGLGLLLQSTGKAQARQQYATFTVQCDRTLEENALSITVLDKCFEMVFAAHHELDFTEICEHIFNTVLEGLNWRISDEIEKTKVGFDISPA